VKISWGLGIDFSSDFAGNFDVQQVCHARIAVFSDPRQRAETSDEKCHVIRDTAAELASHDRRSRPVFRIAVGCESGVLALTKTAPFEAADCEGDRKKMSRIT
jgi:hypothetical protein